MTTFIDSSTSKNCWNLRDSFGEICVCCGCCSSDKRERYKNRLSCINNWIEEEEKFNNWIPEVKNLQKENIKKDLKHLKRRYRYYLNKLKEV